MYLMLHPGAQLHPLCARASRSRLPSTRIPAAPTVKILDMTMIAV